MLVSRSLVIILLLLTVAGGSFAQSIGRAARTEKDVVLSPEGGVVTVTAPTLFAENGDIVAVNIMASDTTGQNITGFEAQIQYDPSVIVPFGANAGCSTTGTIFAAAGASVTCNNNFPAPGVVSVFMFGVFPVTGPGSILRLNFQVVGSGLAVSPLTFNNFIFNEGDPADVTVNGSLTVVTPTAAGTWISGRVLSPSGGPISRARIVLTGQDGSVRSAISNPFG